MPIWTVDEMKGGEYGAVTAGMGSPKAIMGYDFSTDAVNAFNYLAEMETSKKIMFSFPVELGGFNTFVPMLISLVKQVPLIDADGAARAVPALDTLLLHVNGNDTSPLAMASGNNDKVSIVLKDPRAAKLAEDLGRGVCIAFGMKSGLAGWIMEGKAINNTLAVGSVSLCQKIGGAMRQAKIGDPLFSLIQKAAGGTFQCEELDRGVVTDFKLEQKGGFDIGTVTIKGNTGVWTNSFMNENLVIRKDSKPVITAPEIITFYNADTNEAITNADWTDSSGKVIVKNVVCGKIKVDAKWWNTGDKAVNDIWKFYFNLVGYNGDIIKY
jgi:DUF917 family protein